MDQDSDTRQFRDVRDFYAKFLAASSGSDDPRIKEAFTSVKREAFLPPGPWKVFVGNRQQRAYIETSSDDPIHLYHDVLVALDEEKGLNNGQPSLHAVWIGAVAPKPGETVIHIGAGRGYYSAILSRLVQPGGSVLALDIHEGLAMAARDHLASYDNVTVSVADAVATKLPPADIIYVNAGATAPPAAWLEALRIGARLIFPWRASENFGVTLLVTHEPGGFAVKPCGLSSFTACIGATDKKPHGPIPDLDAVRRTRSVQLTSESKPDATATAVYDDIWFSSDEVATQSP